MFAHRLQIAGCLIIVVAAHVRADNPPDFNTAVLPVLQKYCLGCHKTDDSKGGLTMETHADLLNGGGRGAALVPGKPDESLIVRVVEGKSKPKMPPKNNPRPTPEE